MVSDAIIASYQQIRSLLDGASLSATDRLTVLSTLLKHYKAESIRQLHAEGSSPAPSMKRSGAAKELITPKKQDLPDLPKGYAWPTARYKGSQESKLREKALETFLENHWKNLISLRVNGDRVVTRTVVGKIDHSLYAKLAQHFTNGKHLPPDLYIPIRSEITDEIYDNNFGDGAPTPSALKAYQALAKRRRRHQKREL